MKPCRTEGAEVLGSQLYPGRICGTVLMRSLLPAMGMPPQHVIESDRFAIVDASLKEDLGMIEYVSNAS